MIIKIKKMSEVATKKSDHDNGYFIQSAHWGTCFHRKTRKKEYEVRICYTKKPSYLHTYTKYPARLDEQVFDVYINYKRNESPLLKLPYGARVIGFDNPQPSGEHLNRSFLVICPTGEEPVIESLPFGSQAESFWIQSELGEEPKMFDVDSFFKGRKNQVLWLNEEGLQVPHEHRIQ